jgi:hypothetical protein
LGSTGVGERADGATEVTNVGSQTLTPL